MKKADRRHRLSHYWALDPPVVYTDGEGNIKGATREVFLAVVHDRKAFAQVSKGVRDDYRDLRIPVFLEGQYNTVEELLRAGGYEVVDE